MTKPAPYPPDTRAKGWRFELAYEQIEQSDTWAVAAEVPMAQHALLMCWLAAWTQVPCGSMPADENLFRLKCKLTPDAWASMRDVLLRGWWLADDGRLYHDVLVQRAVEMMQKRRKESDRKALARAKTPAGVPPDSAHVPGLSRGTDAGLPPESDTRTSTRDNTHTTLAPEWVLPKTWGEWAATCWPHWTPETIRLVADQFADHQWASAAESADWLATWRKWCRDELTQRAHPAPKPTKAPEKSPPSITVPCTDKGAVDFAASMEARKAEASLPPWSARKEAA